ncbi:16S rRNA (cytosine(1402)-N(4))-methyltransferase RsmH [Candidatus Oleimmundimicrobium sp.]|uniref:16S rRNA (cytosine(1402)-N(4))-methyltransferase RsmH n=1 Tax=Candidatus Oleimmundimicrobium sp. TaxID=3060597 RepID=UPI002728D268|nr:16S rRNA (cytosine(1402)-N(4))-methyltransferase RsmH [Candidatus Oleimmundimicrobium sp.]MDO8885501.1 16S rRNA (cytosine(1402)-N(4))-methyltransferase RsmH [Candidatus Oleimmundimicrobium sp.]
MKYKHIPVLPVEVLKYLKLKNGSIVVDCTLGGAGHAKAILEAIVPDGFLLGIDKDEAAINKAKDELSSFSRQIKLIKGDFANLDDILQEAGFSKVDGILFDLGVSSYQFDFPERGFSYRYDAPLDMRMDLNQKLTAYEVINEYPEAKLTKLMKEYGEERWASRIARFIVEARKRSPIRTTFELVELIKNAIPASARRKGGHPAKRTFQALRIEVNEELTSLEKGLRGAIKHLKPGGRIMIISYHSLEDRIVKNIFKEHARGCVCPPELLVCVCGKSPTLKVLTRKPIVPTEKEMGFNPRSKSAKLRVAEKAS